MKVILIKDVARVGRRNEVKEIPSGHALNFLIPKKLAIIATPENLKQLELQNAKQARTAEVGKGRFFEAVEALTEKPLTLALETNEQGHLFRAVRPEDIVHCAQEAGISIDVSQIALREPIKHVGVYMVALVDGKDHADIELHVTAKNK